MAGSVQWAAGVFVWNGTQILGTSRGKLRLRKDGKRQRHKDWGLPAGKPANSRETPEMVARRALREQTGLYAPCLQHVLTLDPEDHAYAMLTKPFHVLIPCPGVPLQGRVRSTESRRACWLAARSLTTRACSVRDSNRAIIHFLLGEDVDAVW